MMPLSCTEPNRPSVCSVQWPTSLQPSRTLCRRNPVSPSSWTTPPSRAKDWASYLSTSRKFSSTSRSPTRTNRAMAYSTSWCSKPRTPSSSSPQCLPGCSTAAATSPTAPKPLELHRARTVHVVADPPMEVQYDGEATRLTTPFSARILPRAARFFVSEEGYELFGA